MATIDPRSALVALNAARNLSREAVCKLSLGLDQWIEADRTRGSRELARNLGVKSTQLDVAFRAIEQADVTAQRESGRVSDLGAQLLTFLDRTYPEPLRELTLPPPVLYCRGRVPQRPAVSIVGSRQADPGGLEVAEFFADRLAQAGLAIVSGFARGIDTAAHRGALHPPSGATVAVLGSGLDILYPRSNRRLLNQVASRGGLLTEFPLGTPPLAGNFPIRNRIIAALALGTLVVQAAPRSGSLITARLALELGRDVYAVPGPIFEERSIGTNALIQDGALLVQHPRDILESLPIAVKDKLPQLAVPRDNPPPEAPGPAGKTLTALAPGRLLSADQIAEKTGLPVDKTLAALLQLELEGQIRRCPGPAFLRRGVSD